MLLELALCNELYVMPSCFNIRPEELPVFRCMFDLLTCFLKPCLLFVEYWVVNNLEVILEDMRV
jgi:hypothetical protein